ncbi:MAG: transposase, partial [Chloroflexota bacterium]|nr:transposase [Chloroflexota bacterium]
PIRKGKLKTPTEIGRTLRVDQNEEGYSTGCQVFVGNPGDACQPQLAVERHIEVFGEPPKQLAGDRGMGCPTNDRKLTKLGVEDICLPRPGPLTQARKAVEQEPTFWELKKWRAGIEALISVMKRVLGWDRCLFAGTSGAEAWTDWSVLTYNLRRYGRAKAAQAA